MLGYVAAHSEILAMAVILSKVRVLRADPGTASRAQYKVGHVNGTSAVRPPLLQGVPQLSVCLSEETEHHIKAATVWSIGQIGHHSPEHATAVTKANLLPKLLELYMDAGSSEDLQAKVGADATARDYITNGIKIKLCRFRKKIFDSYTSA